MANDIDSVHSVEPSRVAALIVVILRFAGALPPGMRKAGVLVSDTDMVRVRDKDAVCTCAGAMARKALAEGSTTATAASATLSAHILP